MKRIFAVVLLTTILVSCQKDHSSEPSTPSTGQLTSLWTYHPGFGLLSIDSLEYDDQQKLARLRFFSFPDLTEMAIPKQYNDSTDSAVFTFAYERPDSLPSSYTFMIKNQDLSVDNEHHIISYDGEGRITGDSVVGVTGNDIDGYSTTGLYFRKVHYSYSGSNIVCTQFKTDASIEVDSIWINNDNVTEVHRWNYDSKVPENNFSSKIVSNSYSGIDNPLFRYRIMGAYHLASSFFDNETLTAMSRKLETSATWTNTYMQLSTLHTTIQWTADDKGRPISGDYTDDGDASSGLDVSKYFFHYK